MWTWNRDGDLINLGQAVKLEILPDSVHMGGRDDGYAIVVTFAVPDEFTQDGAIYADPHTDEPEYRKMMAQVHVTLEMDAMWGTFPSFEAAVAAMEKIGDRLGVIDPEDLGAEKPFTS